jgi:hypothetical protein
MFYACMHIKLIGDFMNVAKRLLTAAVTAGVLGIGAGAERRPKTAKFDDGDYDFYFRNGVHGDCDGYNSKPGGKTKIYE